MTWTTDDLSAIEAAIALGSTTVAYKDRRQTYRSLDEMLRIRDLIRGEVNPPAAPRPTHMYGSFSKGLR